jgi:Rrf2 family protein
LKLITRETDYAVRALASIYENEKKIVSVSDLVKEIEIPRPFLRKLLQILNKAGILDSFKGKGGGFILKKDPKDILLLDLMEIFQGKFKINECVFKKEVCKNISNCILKKKIDHLESYIYDHLKTITLLDLIEGSS